MKWNITNFIFILLGSILPENIFAQSLAINTDGSIANSSSILDIKSTEKGILIPRMTKAQKNAITAPATGLLVFQTSPDSTGFQYYDGSRWNWLSFMNAVDTLVWKTGGNAGTDTSRHFMGTKDAMPLRFKQNNQWIGQLNANNRNYFIGRGTGQRLTTGSGNTAFGDSSLTAITGQNEMTAFGYRALKRNINLYNSAFGAYALENNFDGFSNTALGYQSQYNTKNGYFNLSAGAYSLFSDTLGLWNTALGAFSLYQNKTNQYNTAVGSGSLYNAGLNIGGPFDGGYNTGVGVQAGFSITTGYSNTVIGVASGIGLITGIGNTAVGAYALNTNRRGNGHVSMGYFSLLNDTSNNNLNPNVAIGRESLRSNISGYGNTAIGTFTGFSNISGNHNTFLGINTANNNFSNTTTVGAHAFADTNNALILGSINGVNGATADVNVGIGTTQPLHFLHVVNTNPNDGGWEQGIMVENTSPIATAGEAAISFRNANISVGSQWNVGINQSPFLAFNYGNSFVGGNTRMVIDTVGNVGIGTITPSNKVHVSKGSSGGTFNANSTLILEDNSSVNIQLSNPNASQTGILSGNAETTLRAALIFNADSSFTIRTGGSFNRLTVENNGNVGINTTAPNSKLEVNGSFANAIQIITANITLDEFDHTIIISSSVGAGALTVTLPAASTCSRREYVIVNQNASVKNIGGFTYRDLTNSVSTTIPGNTSLTIQSDGITWYRTR